MSPRRRCHVAWCSDYIDNCVSVFLHTIKIVIIKMAMNRKNMTYPGNCARGNDDESYMSAYERLETREFRENNNIPSDLELESDEEMFANNVDDTLALSEMFLSSCQSPPNVNKVMGKSSNSVSKSDILVLSMDDDDRDIVLKVFATNNYGLLYESRVYEYIRDQVIPKKRLYNLATFVARSSSCGLRELMTITKTEPENVYKLLNNLIYMICGFKNRPALQDSNFEVLKNLFSTSNERQCWDQTLHDLLSRPLTRRVYTEIVRYISENYKFGYMATVRMKGIPMGVYVKRSLEGMHAYIFQIFYTIYVLNYFGINHNDLHAYNVIMDFWDEAEKRQDRYYRVGDMDLEIDTPYVPRIYDWDHAYVRDLGPNPYLGRGRIFGTNSFVSRYRDFVRFSCSLSYYLQHENGLDRKGSFVSYMKHILFKPSHHRVITEVWKRETDPNAPDVPCIFSKAQNLLVNEKSLAYMMYEPYEIVKRAAAVFDGDLSIWNASQDGL